MKKNLPQHVAIIPDANRRWAKERGLPVIEGHREGYKRIKEVAQEAKDQGIKYLTLWTGSEDNLRKRSRIEVKFLAKLLKLGISDDLLNQEFMKWKSNVRVIGKWDEILKDKDLRELVSKIEDKSKDFHDRFMTILFGYNGTSEMIEAIKKLKSKNEEVTAENIKSNLWTGHLPEVDLVIRTGGEPHWSAGFMMWLTANSQFHFAKTKWPDFGKKEFQIALDEYAERERRRGK